MKIEQRKLTQRMVGRGGPLPQMFANNISGMMILGLFTLASAIGTIYTKHLKRSLHIQLEQLQDSRDKLHVEWTQLLLEEGTLGSDVRVEKVAREQLKMITPVQSHTVVIKP